VPLHRNRDFNLLWSGQALSDLGTQISAIAYPLLVLAVTGSAAEAGIVASATLLGTLVGLLPGGVVADRYPRKRIMVVTSLTQMVVGATVVVAAVTHHIFLAHLASVGFIQGAAFAFYIGASRGATRRIVTPEQLPGAMARTQARDRAATMIGPPIGGALFGVAQFLPFACDSGSFGAIALAAALLRKPLDPVPTGVAETEPLRQRVTKGLRFVLAQPFLRMFVIWATAINALVAGVRLTIIVLAQRRGATPTEIGALFTISAGCGLAGALVAVRLTKLASGRTLTLIAAWLFPACAVGMVLSPWIWLIALMAGITGFGIMPVNVILTAEAARITPDDMQAQSGNAMQLCYTSLAWIAPTVFGAVTDALGAEKALLIAAGLYGLTAVWLQFHPQLRLLRRGVPASPTP
jgi:MFS family permease